MVGAPSMQSGAIGEEPALEVERRCGPGRQEASAARRRDRSEAGGDIAAAGEDYRLDTDADRALRCAGVIAAIEDEGGVGRRYCFARGVRERLEPAGSPIDSGIGGAQQRDRPPDFGGRGERGQCLGQRMDDHDWGVAIRGVQPARAPSP